MVTLVTGAAGFLGRAVVESLRAEGRTVVGVDNFLTADRLEINELSDDPGFAFVEHDVRSEAFRSYAATLPLDGIYHLACPTGVPNLEPMALEMLETCYVGSQAVLELAREQGVPVVLASSAEVYGDPEVSPQRETYTGNVSPLGPRKGYEEGKRVAETLFGIYAERYGVAAKIARVFNSYGPGMSMGDTRVIPAFTQAAIRGEDLQVHGDGSQDRCYAFVTDTVRGIRAVLERGRPARAYNLGSEDRVSVHRLAELVITAAQSRSAIEFVARPNHDHQTRLPDTERARSELGWQAIVPLEDGLRETVAGFRCRLETPRASQGRAAAGSAAAV